MDDRQRVIDYIRDIGEYVQTSEGRVSASQMLERFLFTPDMQYSPVESSPAVKNAGFIFWEFSVPR